MLAATARVAAQPVFRSAFSGWQRRSYFGSPQETAARLARAGFEDVRCWLEPYPVDPEDPAAYLRTITLRDRLAELPPALADVFVDGVLAELPKPISIDYVRLNIDARRPA